MPKFEKDYKEKTLKITFSNNKHRTIRITAFPEEIIEKLALYGLQVRLTRSYAGIKDDSEKDNAVRTMLDQMLEGKWTEKVNPNKIAVKKTIETLKQTLEGLPNIPEVREKIEQRIAELEKQL